MSTEALARNVVKIRYDDLSEEVREATKRSILDTLGVMLPPTTLEKTCVALYELVKEAGGKRESTLIGFGGKAPCWVAAFVNGSLAHAIDYDDGVVADVPVHHPTASTFPAALAIAERIDGVSGKDFITAITLGNDLSIRLAACPKGNTMMDYPFFPITTFGVFGAAAAAGKLLGLSEVEMLNALGMALHRVAGVTEAMLAPDSDLRAIRDAFTNKEGVISALMASKGIAACKDVVEKLFKVYYGGRYNPQPLTLDLGKKFRGVEASLKPWPACGQTHGYIQAVLQITKEYDINPDQIDEVMLTGGKSGERLCMPPEVKQEPVSSMAAKFSIPFVVAVALVKRSVVIGHFLPQNLKDPEVIRVAKKVRHKVDPTFGVFTPVIAEIRTKGGKSYSFKADTIHGHPRDPLSVDELIAKFRDCANYSKKHLSSAKVDRLITTILQLEKLGDVREITAILA